MARTPKSKELEHTRLANGYGGWIYCDSCGKTIGYLCYVTYDSFEMRYQCRCGSCGSIRLAFEEKASVGEHHEPLIAIKKRWCCPTDQSPLFSIVEKNLTHYSCEATCADCGMKFKKEG